MLALAVVISTAHLEADVTAAGGDFVDVAFEVPVGTAEIRISHTDGDPDVILDFGVWSPEGFRGWGGGNTEDVIIGVAQSSRSYLPGAITAGFGWTAYTTLSTEAYSPGLGGDLWIFGLAMTGFGMLRIFFWRSSTFSRGTPSPPM